MNRGVTWGEKYFRKNDLAAVYRLDQNQRKPEGKRGHDNSAGLTWGQQGNKKEKRDKKKRKRENDNEPLHWLNSPEQTVL